VGPPSSIPLVVDGSRSTSAVEAKAAIDKRKLGNMYTEARNVAIVYLSSVIITNKRVELAVRHALGMAAERVRQILRESP